jgi:hypothetical protein
MTLRDPETRKALRAIVGAILALTLVALVWAHAGRLTGGLLAQLLLMALAIIALRVLFDGAENVTNAVRFKLGGAGLEGSVTDDVIKDGNSVTINKEPGA